MVGLGRKARIQGAPVYETAQNTSVALHDPQGTKKNRAATYARHPPGERHVYRKVAVLLAAAVTPAGVGRCAAYLHCLG